MLYYNIEVKLRTFEKYFEYIKKSFSMYEKISVDIKVQNNDSLIISIFPHSDKSHGIKGLIMKEYAGTSNGRFIKWFDSTGTMIFEWDEDLLNGSHYHIMVHDGIHYLPGSVVPKPYASLYF